MRFHTRLSPRIATTLCTAGVLICTTMPAFATLRTLRNPTVTAVRAYADGNMHITLSATTLCAGSGSLTSLRVGGDGAARVHESALAAPLNERRVNIEYDDVRDGNFCNLVSIRIK